MTQKYLNNYVILKKIEYKEKKSAFFLGHASFVMQNNDTLQNADFKRKNIGREATKMGKDSIYSSKEVLKLRCSEPMTLFMNLDFNKVLMNRIRIFGKQKLNQIECHG